MNEYVKQAREFLEACNATMKITWIGCEINKNWNDNIRRNVYRATIKTPKGVVWVKFWDSAYNTERGMEPTEYDVIACLEKYDAGTIDDFVNEYGYEVNEWADVKRIQSLYNAVKRQYKSLCRCFTPDQINAMREIC